MDSDLDRAGVIHDDPGFVAVLRGARARQECAVSVNAVLCADGADVSALVCGGLHAGIWLLRG